MEEEVDFNMDVPLSQAFKRKRQMRKKESQVPTNNSTEDTPRPEHAAFPTTTENLNSSIPPGFLVSEFNYSVESHFKDIDMISKFCGYPKILNANHPEFKRLSNSITFLREWRDFKYAPRVIRFASQHSSKEKEVMGGITLPQFSAASVPKEAQNGGRAGAESRDFVMNAGGAIWALDWCPRADHNFENHIKSEFVAIAAHPPESSYHKIGAPLTGRGAIQIWCLLTCDVKEDVPSQGSKTPRSNSQKKVPAKSSETNKTPRPRGRPRKKPINDSAEKIDTKSLNSYPLSIEYPDGSTMLLSPDITPASTCKHANNEVSARTYTNVNHTVNTNVLLLSAPEVEQNKAEAGKENQVHNNGVHIPRQCELGDSVIVNQTACPSPSVDSMSYNNHVTCISSYDTNTSSNSIPEDVALPRMMLCLAHNGKVAWDVKWKPVNAEPQSKNVMGYLAILLGNGALEVWEVPFPHIVKLLYPAEKDQVDPRFVKLQPVFRCSMLKCGNRQSIPLTVEWSVSSPNDMLLAGCHDGVVALWKFSVTDSLTETRPILSFSADTGPIRTLSWAPMPSDPGSANIIVTAGHKGFKLWDIRDPFRPLWDYPLQGITFGLDWLPDPRCVFGSTDDGSLWLLSLARAACDIPITGKSFTVTPKQGFHIFLCSSFSIWNVQASRSTGMVAYCGEEGTTFCFKPTTRSVRDPSRNRMHHYLCGSLLEEESALIVATPSTNSLYQKRSPNLKRQGLAKELDRRIKQLPDKDQTCNEPTLAICDCSDSVEELGSNKPLAAIERQAQKKKKPSKNESKPDQQIVLCRNDNAGKGETDKEMEVFPPKSVAMHRVRWNVNKGSEKWLCYGGAAGLVRCQQVDLSGFQ